MQAQDKIVTTSGDTIECRIVSVSGDFIVYEQFASDKGFVGNRLPVEQMSAYIKGKDSNDKAEQKKSIPRPAQRWQLGIQGGAGYLLASTKGMEKSLIDAGADEKLAKDFSKELKWGYHYGADIHYMYNKQRGVGIKYSGFYTSASNYMIFDTHDGGVTYWCANMEKRYYINFIGFSFRTQQYFTRSDKFRIGFDAAFGYAHYRDEEEYDNYMQNNYLLKSNSFGWNMEFSIEYSPLTWVSIGAHISYFGSWFWKGTLTDGYNSATVKFKDVQMDNINASRLDLSIGIKFYF